MSLPLLFSQKRGGRRLTTFSHSHPTSLSSNSALCLWKPNLLLMLSELVNVISDVNSDVVRSLTELLFPVKISVNHPVAAVRGGGSDFRSMFCSFALSRSDISSSSLSCECVVCLPRTPPIGEPILCLSSNQNARTCQQGVGRSGEQQNVGEKRMPYRIRSVYVANCFLLSFTLVLISLSEWLVLHCYHRKEFRRKGC